MQKSNMNMHDELENFNQIKDASYYTRQPFGPSFLEYSSLCILTNSS